MLTSSSGCDQSNVGRPRCQWNVAHLLKSPKVILEDERPGNGPRRGREGGSSPGNYPHLGYVDRSARHRKPRPPPGTTSWRELAYPDCWEGHSLSPESLRR